MDGETDALWLNDGLIDGDSDGERLSESDGLTDADRLRLCDSEAELDSTATDSAGVSSSAHVIST